MNDYLQFVATNISAIVAIIGLLMTTITYIVKSVREQNWAELVRLVLTDMAEAEKLFDKGSDKKKYCLDRLMAHADFVHYPLDDTTLERISKLIDDICDTSNAIA